MEAFTMICVFLAGLFLGVVLTALVSANATCEGMMDASCDGMMMETEEDDDEA